MATQDQFEHRNFAAGQAEADCRAGEIFAALMFFNEGGDKRAGRSVQTRNAHGYSGTYAQRAMRGP